MKSKQKALLVADLARSKKAEDIVILDMRKVSNITDYFVISTASSTTRAQTIADNIETGLRKSRERIASVEGYGDAQWILIDAYDVVCHVFNSELRRYYNLDGLWGDAPRVKLCRKKTKTTTRKTSRRK